MQTQLLKDNPMLASFLDRYDFEAIRKQKAHALRAEKLKVIAQLIVGHDCFEILEFGSGASTQMFHDMAFGNLHAGLYIRSFDHDSRYAHKNARIRPLNIEHHECGFYSLLPGDLAGQYDFVLIDGPHKWGRAQAFSHIADHVHEGSLLFIDDAGEEDPFGYCNAALKVFPKLELIRDRNGYAVGKVIL